MSDLMIPVVKRRYAWVAVVLSLVLSGLGQVYCGKLTRGLLYACLSALAIPVTAALIANQAPLDAFGLALFGVAGLMGITLVATIDAFRLARRERTGYELKEYNRLAVYLLLLLTAKGGQLGALLYTRDHLLEAFVVPSASMCPTIAAGDKVLGNKLAYRDADPRRGDIVIFRPPDDWRQLFVKRIVAVEGDTVAMKAGRLRVNGRELEQRPVQEAVPEGCPPDGVMTCEVNGDTRYYRVDSNSVAHPFNDLAEITVPPHHCFLLGDARAVSRDSRDFGPVPYSSVVARADYLYWPAHDWSRFGRLSR